MRDAADNGRAVVVIQARVTSTRLPGKILLPLGGKSLLSRVIERARAIPGVDGVVVAAPKGQEHNAIAEIVERHPGVMLVRGSESDLLERTLVAARAAGADVVVRVTSDCPCIDPAVSGAVLAAFRAAPVVYARTDFTRGYPHGLDTEVVAVSALEDASGRGPDDYEREHATPFIWRRPDLYPAVHLLGLPDRRHWRLTVDEPQDYQLIKEIYDDIGTSRPMFGLDDLVELFGRRPELLAINQSVVPTPYVGLTPQREE
jgi:spore coat polysaccharide biosynthesis protein SpsF (cytidylyltransferase family)